MIQPQRLKGKAGNIARYYTVGDYYTKGGDEPSEWGGKLAIDLGLSGPVDPKIFRDLLAGKVGEQQLGRVRKDGEIQHHPGWDFAVTARRQAALERELKNYNRRERPPSGLAEHAAQGARDLASGLDRFLTGILTRARDSGSDKPIADHQPMPARDVAQQSHAGPER